VTLVGTPDTTVRSVLARSHEAQPAARPRSGRVQGCAPAVGGGSERGIPLPRNPACGPKRAHRVGVASVQLTRSTFAEATAGRECLQPRALRARCTRKLTGTFARRQASCRGNVSQIATNSFGSQLARKFGSRHKCTEVGGSLVRPPNRPPPKRLPVGGPSTSGAPSSVHTGHYDAILVPSSWNRPRNPALCGLFRTHRTRLRLGACALEWKGPWIRRAGCAFVHFPG
jgi:hypothetical protein